jgi:DNA-binding NarL/FixJ family response regulator
LRGPARRRQRASAVEHEQISRRVREQREGWEVCAEASNGREAVELAAKLHPQVVLLDLSMPEMNGFEATRRIERAFPNTEVLVLSMHDAEHFVQEALEAGALGYLLKSDAARYITAAVEALCEHNPYFTGSVQRTMLNIYPARIQASAETEPSLDQFSTREREIIQLLAEGRSNRGVSVLLNISTKTAETHRATIFKMLGVHSVAKLVRFAVRNRVIDP